MAYLTVEAEEILNVMPMGVPVETRRIKELLKGKLSGLSPFKISGIIGTRLDLQYVRTVRCYDGQHKRNKYIKFREAP